MSDEIAQKVKRRLADADWDVTAWIGEFGHHAQANVDVADRLRLIKLITVRVLEEHERFKGKP